MPDGPVPELPSPCSCARFLVRRGDILSEISLIPEWVGTSPRTCFAKQLVPSQVPRQPLTLGDPLTTLGQAPQVTCRLTWTTPGPVRTQVPCSGTSAVPSSRRRRVAVPVRRARRPRSSERLGALRAGREDGLPSPGHPWCVWDPVGPRGEGVRAPHARSYFV